MKDITMQINPYKPRHMHSIQLRLKHTRSSSVEILKDFFAVLSFAILHKFAVSVMFAFLMFFLKYFYLSSSFYVLPVEIISDIPGKPFVRKVCFTQDLYSFPIIIACMLDFFVEELVGDGCKR